VAVISSRRLQGGSRRVIVMIGISAGGVLAAQALAAGAEQPHTQVYRSTVIDPASVPSAAHAPTPETAELPRTGPGGSQLPLLGGAALVAAYGLNRYRATCSPRAAL
jgi:acetyl esterase/lipase